MMNHARTLQLATSRALLLWQSLFFECIEAIYKKEGEDMVNNRRRRRRGKKYARVSSLFC